jgi:molybdopterin molybdotransferase
MFLKVKTAAEVLSILEGIEPLSAEHVSLGAACGRRLACDIAAGEPVPHFARATMDGYAVLAQDTFGASESMPAVLERSGEVAMGEAPRVRVTPGKAVEVPTGAMLPEGADAVVMVEYTQALDSTTIEITRPAAPGDNVLKAGEDIAPGTMMFRKGAMLRPQDIGVLAALGICEVEVFRVPRVALISTGDELLPVETCGLEPGKVRDINSFSLAAQIESAGARVEMRKWVADRLEDLVAACRKALAGHDVIVLSGGSSVGARDYTTRVLGGLPESKLIVHGIAIRPGKPTIFGRAGRPRPGGAADGIAACGGKVLFWGLPGQPVSALITCREFVLASLQKLQGMPQTEAAHARSIRAVLSRQVPSVHGRTDYVPVALGPPAESAARPQDGQPGFAASPPRGSGKYGRSHTPLVKATPIFGKSGAISILARADGYVVIEENVEGLEAGAEVSVFLF